MSLVTTCQLCRIKTFAFNNISGRILCCDCQDEYKAIFLGSTSIYYEYISLTLDNELKEIKGELSNGT
jgi:hypothetical protein